MCLCVWRMVSFSIFIFVFSCYFWPTHLPHFICVCLCVVYTERCKSHDKKVQFTISYHKWLNRYRLILWGHDECMFIIVIIDKTNSRTSSQMNSILHITHDKNEEKKACCMLACLEDVLNSIYCCLPVVGMYSEKFLIEINPTEKASFKCQELSKKASVKSNHKVAILIMMNRRRYCVRGTQTYTLNRFLSAMDETESNVCYLRFEQTDMYQPCMKHPQ